MSSRNASKIIFLTVGFNVGFVTCRASAGRARWRKRAGKYGRNKVLKLTLFVHSERKRELRMIPLRLY